MTVRKLLVAVVFAEIFLFGLTRDTDIDFWWHLKTGDLVIETGSIPFTDPFSSTAAGQPWTAHEWLWEVSVSLLYGMGGYRLLAVLSALLVASGFVLLYRLVREQGVNEFVAISLVLWAASMALPDIGVRPRELTLWFLTLFLCQLTRYRSGHAQHLWILPPAMAIWVNVHGAFALGLMLAALFAADEVVHWCRHKNGQPRHIVTVLALTAAAALLNPHGPEIFWYPFNYYLGVENPSFEFVREFASPDFHNPLLFSFALVLVTLMLTADPWTENARLHFLLIVAFGVPAFLSTRQVSVYAIVIAPILAERLARLSTWARSRPDPLLTPGLRRLNWGLCAVTLLCGLLYVRSPFISDRLQLSWQPKSSNMPREGADFILAHELPFPVFNEQAWGGYLIHRWYPQGQVFIDGRIDMYGPEIVRDYLSVVHLEPGWHEILARHSIQTVLVRRDSKLAVLLRMDPRWKHEFEGKIEDIFARRRNGSDVGS